MNSLFYPSVEELYKSAGVPLWDVEEKIDLLEKVIAELAPNVTMLRKGRGSDYREQLQQMYGRLRYAKPDLPIIIR
jgi:hypothetical protein